MACLDDFLLLGLMTYLMAEGNGAKEGVTKCHLVNEGGRFDMIKEL